MSEPATVRLRPFTLQAIIEAGISSAETIAQSDLSIARAAVEACAREVEAAGKCICPDLTDTDHIVWKESLGEWDPGTEEDVVQHDPRCPVALVARLREMVR